MGSMLLPFKSLHDKWSTEEDVNGFFFITDPSIAKKHLDGLKIEKDRLLFEYSVIDYVVQDKSKTQALVKLLDQEYPMAYSMFADRRLASGKYAKHQIDKFAKISSYNHDELICSSTEQFFNFITKNKIDIIITHGVSTFGIHIIYAISQYLGIKFLNLRHTKVMNYMTFGTGVDENFVKIVRQMEEDHSETELKYATDYIKNTSTRKIHYSGHRYFNDKSSKILSEAPKELAKHTARAIKSVIMRNESYFEPSYNHLYLWFLNYIKRPIKMMQANGKGIDLHSLSQTKKKYIFLPLHAEPEVSLSVYARRYSNQVEFVRQVSLSLPYEYELIVKDHPRNFGKRSKHFFREISSIPNVRLLKPSVNSLSAIDASEGVVMLSGFVGFEAILRQKPVYCFGRSILSNFSKHIPVTNCNDFDDLRASLRNQKPKCFRKTSLLVSSIIRESEEIEIMTVLLKKKNRHGNPYSEERYAANIEALLKLVKRNI